MTKVIKAYSDAVAKQCEATGHSSWGANDSTAVIEAVADSAYLDEEEEGKGIEGFDAIRDLVKALCNPSAFRQGLEKRYDPKTQKGVNGTLAYIKPTEQKRGGTKTAFSALS